MMGQGAGCWFEDAYPVDLAAFDDEDAHAVAESLLSKIIVRRQGLDGGLKTL